MRNLKTFENFDNESKSDTKVDNKWKFALRPMKGGKIIWHTVTADTESEAQNKAIEHARNLGERIYAGVMKEKANESLSEDLSTKISDEFKEIKSDLLDMIETSVNSNDMDVVNEFIESFLQDDSESVIEGLVNDSDVYEFYLKHTESIDEILNDGDFFSVSPEEQGVVGLYDYMVYGTRKAVTNIVNRIKKDIEG